MPDLNFNKLTLFLFMSLFTNIHIISSESKSLDQETDTVPSLYELIDPAVLAKLGKGYTGSTGSPGITEISGIASTSESCGLWENFLVYLFCAEISGHGSFMTLGRPPIFTQSRYIDQKAVDACHDCLKSFRSCCESNVQATYKNTNT